MWNIQKLVSKGDYVYAVVPEHPVATKHGYVLHHRIVAENFLNRLLSPNEIVHHKNHNKKDNSPDNLEVMTRREHSFHHKNGTGHEDVTMTCVQCNKLFKRNYRNRPEVKKNINVFCSRVCNGKYQRAKQLASVSPHASNVMKG